MKSRPYFSLRPATHEDVVLDAGGLGVRLLIDALVR